MAVREGMAEELGKILSLAGLPSRRNGGGIRKNPKFVRIAISSYKF
jgi:hypothetical protein